MDQESVILSQLNETQREAVMKIDGPLMVIAGAGSGKTRVLTYRIAYMLAKGINPFNILSLTFTNKAAREMKERITQLVGDSRAKAVNMGTFHAVFYRILRTEAEKLGYTKNLTVYDTDDAKGVIKSIVKEMNLDPKVYLANFVLQRISAAKSSLLSAEEYARSPEIIEADMQSGRPYVADIFLRYNNRLKNADAMDFDDLLYYMNILLRDFPEMLYKYQNRFRYILVDEYQDTNYAQYIIVKKLAAAHQNICVVGDDAQSIYAFRGANIQNILNFRKDFPTAVTVKLEQNYRSTQNIVNAANAVIKHNQAQIQKDVWTDNGEGNKIHIVRSGTDSEEATMIAGSIFETKLNYQLDNSKFAVLYRTNAQSRPLEEALIKKNIPYVIYGGLSFYKRKEIKNVLAYFRLTINNFDEESLLRVINYPQRGIGATTIDKLKVAASEQNTRLWNLVEDPDAFGLDINTSTKLKLKDFATRIKSFSATVPTSDAYSLGKHIVNSTGIWQDLKEDVTEKERLDNVESLLDSMKEFIEKEPEAEFDEETGELITEYFPSLDRFMTGIALLTDEESKEDGSHDKVKLMTIHSAKGLEFDYVYVSGLEENLFPSSLSLGSRAELEEERRLFYVAVTRAKKMLTLTHAQTRIRYGSRQFCEPSRFLEEIPLKYIHTTEKASVGSGIFKKEKPLFSSLGTTKTSFTRPIVKKLTTAEVSQKQIGPEAMIDDILEGKKVYHAKFGYGNVLMTEGRGQDKKAVIRFDTVGEKTLLLKFAKLIIPAS